MVRDRKYVIPFPNGITIPTEDFVETEHDRVLSFPASYQPAIMSALKVLARPETYQSTDVADLNASVQQGYDILASIRTYPAPISSLYATLSGGAFYGSQINTWNDPYTGTWHGNIVQGSDALSASSIHINVKTHPFDAVAGTQVNIQLRFLPLNAKAYVVTGHSCTGLISDSGFTFDGYLNFSFSDAKDLVISVDAINSAQWDIVLPGDIVCGDI